jgi:hypothetical protein
MVRNGPSTDSAVMKKNANTLRSWKRNLLRSKRNSSENIKQKSKTFPNTSKLFL